MAAQTNLDEVKITAQCLLMTEVHKTEYSPIIVQHPFTSSGIAMLPGTNELLDITANAENQDKWRNYVSGLIKKAESAYDIFMLLNKGYAMTFLKFANYALSDEDLAQILADAWVQAENPNMDCNVTKAELVSMFKRSDKAHLMTEAERRRLCINHKRYKNCKQDAIKEEDLERTFVALMKDIVADKSGFIETVISNIEEVVRNRQSESSVEEIDAKIIKIQNQMIGLVSNMTMTNTTEISAKTQEMLAEIERLKQVKETTIAEGLQLQVDLGRMDSLREILNTEEVFDKFNDGIFRRVVDKVLIDGKTATFVLCDTMRITRPILQGTENE